MWPAAGAGEYVLVPDEQWAQVGYCDRGFETFAEGPGVRLSAVQDRDAPVQWIVANAADIQADAVAGAPARSGACVRIEPNGKVFAPCSVAAVDGLRGSTFGFTRVLSADPPGDAAATRWIGYLRTSWPGMARHVDCMEAAHRADGPCFVPFRIRHASMRPADKGRFLREYPVSAVRDHPSEVVGHSHSTGLVRGGLALCATPTSG